MTYTRTHVYTSFANPYLVCELCHRPVPRWHDQGACGCHLDSFNAPCGHRAEAVSACPSWSPVDGCPCAGANPHRIHRAIN